MTDTKKIEKLLEEVQKIKQIVTKEVSVENFITLKELCSILNISQRSYYQKYRTNYQFPHYKIGGKLYFNKYQVGKYIMNEKILIPE